MSNGKEKPPFYERRLFQGTAAAVALVTAVLALRGQLADLFDDLFPSKPPPVSWVEVVLNTSSVMGEHFGKNHKTRLASAARGIAKAVKELDDSGVGLRRTPASCEGESEPLVDLADGNADEVISKAQRQHPTGNASIVDAVAAALNEFDREPIDRGAPKSRSILIFTTPSERCPYDDAGKIEDILAKTPPRHIPGVEVFELAPEGEEQASGSLQAGQPQSRLAAFGGIEGGGTELEAVVTALSQYTEPHVHSVGSPEELDAAAENVGKEAVKTAEQLEEQREREETEGPSG